MSLGNTFEILISLTKNTKRNYQQIIQHDLFYLLHQIVFKRSIAIVELNNPNEDYKKLTG